MISIVLALIAGFSLVSGVSQFANHYQHQHAASLADKRHHFWRVVAGQENADAPTVENRLAEDLRSRLGPVNPNATLPESITAFRGDSNAYGGITDGLGYDPFDESGLACSECGPLDGRTKTALLLVKRGQLSVVLADGPRPVAPYHLWTPLGLPAATWGLLVLFLCLVIYYVQPIYALFASRSLEKKMRECYPEDMHMLDSVDNMLARVSLKYGDHPKVEALQASRDTLYSDLVTATRARDEGDLEFTLKEVESRMSDVKNGLAARKEAIHELEKETNVQQEEGD